MNPVDKRAAFLTIVQAVIQAQMNDAVAEAPADRKTEVALRWATALSEAFEVADRLPLDRTYRRCVDDFILLLDNRDGEQPEWTRLPSRMGFMMQMDPGDELIDGVWQPVNRSWAGLPTGQSASLKTLDHIRRHGPATTAELRRRFPEISGQRLAKALRDREAEDWIKRGPGTGPDTLWLATEQLTQSMPAGQKAWTPPPPRENTYQRPTLEERNEKLAKRPETIRVLKCLRKNGPASSAALRVVSGIADQRRGLALLQKMQAAGWIRVVGLGRGRAWSAVGD